MSIYMLVLVLMVYEWWLFPYFCVSSVDRERDSDGN